MESMHPEASCTRDVETYSERHLKGANFQTDTVRRRREDCGFDTSMHSWLMSHVTLLSLHSPLPLIVSGSSLLPVSLHQEC